MRSLKSLRGRKLESREEILYETYAKTLNIEALTMIHMASRQLLPVCISYSKKLADAVIAVTEAGADASVQEELLNEVSRELKSAKLALEALKIDEEKAGKITDARNRHSSTRMSSKRIWMPCVLRLTTWKCWLKRICGRCRPMRI